MNSVRSPVSVRLVAAEEIEERDAIRKRVAKGVGREERAGRRLAAGDDVEAGAFAVFAEHPLGVDASPTPAAGGCDVLRSVIWNTLTGSAAATYTRRRDSMPSRACS